MNFREFFITNTWWGKILGAFFGYLTGGSMGALFGILLGNFFDRGLASHFSNPHWLYHAEKRKLVQKVFFETTFSVMGHIAKADGVVTQQELQMAQQLMDEMRLSREQKTLAKRLFNEGKQSNYSLNTVLTLLKTTCRENRELLKLFVDIQYRASLIDGLSPKKMKVLDEIFTFLGFAPLHKQYRFYEDFGYRNREQPEEPRQQQSSRGHYQTPSYALDHAFALLEVEPTASKSDVKRAYRRLMSRNHPDKLIAQGLPQEMIKIANDKTQKILKAYELICDSKGW